jgi:hypothetical protein
VATLSDTSRPVHDIEEHADATGIGSTGPGESLPGDTAPEPVTALLDGEAADRFRDRWQQLQLRFIDDPQAVAAAASGPVDEVLTALHDAVDQRRAAFEPESPGEGSPRARPGHRAAAGRGAPLPRLPGSSPRPVTRAPMPGRESGPASLRFRSTRWPVTSWRRPRGEIRRGAVSKA